MKTSEALLALTVTLAAGSLIDNHNRKQKDQENAGKSQLDKLDRVILEIDGDTIGFVPDEQLKKEISTATEKFLERSPERIGEHQLRAMDSLKSQSKTR